MAAFGLLYSPPATAHFSNNTLFLPSSPHNHCLLSLTNTRRRRANLQLLLVQSSPQVEANPAAVQSESPEPNVAEVVEDEVSQTRLLLQNVPWTCTADDLRPLLEKYGTVVDIEFSMYNKSRNRGLAFVTMGSHEEAVAALTSLNSSEFEGRVLQTNWAKPKKTKPLSVPEPKPLPVHNLYVTNLPFQARAKDLRDFFNADNANVVSAEIIFQDTRRSAGYGFVSFNTKAEAEAALTAFQGKEFMGRLIRVAFSKRFLRQVTKETIESESSEVA